jgi:uncharacterized protein YyaL (SSP411 family)
MTGQGGWPMTCMLTPTGEPFFAGTYYPREPRLGMPAFTQVLQAIVTAWTERRDEVTKISADVAEHLSSNTTVLSSDSDDVGALAVEQLKETFDQRYAGFGRAPKFPPSMLCEFLLRRSARTGEPEALRMAEQTLEAMARGGLYDQLGGGFARYSVDGRWDVPHFEKMLYDNALLLRVYTHWFRQTAHPLAERIARETADFMLRELRTPQHGFASALDAAWNGLAIAALVETGVILDEPRYVEMAESVGELLVSTHFDEDGRLLRVSRDGIAGSPQGVLEDYACVADGFLALFSATGARVWFEHAHDLVAQIHERFADGRGGFYDTPADAEKLLKRPQDAADNATPSGQAMTASVLVTMAALTGDETYREAAERVLSSMSGLAERAPRFAGQSLAALEALVDGPRQVAIVGADGDPTRDALVKAAFMLPYPGVVIAQGPPGEAPVALLAHRGLVDGQPAAYLCHDFVCDLPVTDPAALH